MSRNFKWYVPPSIDGFDKVMSKEFKNYLIKNSMKQLKKQIATANGDLEISEYAEHGHQSVTAYEDHVTVVFDNIFTNNSNKFCVSICVDANRPKINKLRLTMGEAREAKNLLVKIFDKIDE